MKQLLMTNLLTRTLIGILSKDTCRLIIHYSTYKMSKKLMIEQLAKQAEIDCRNQFDEINAIVEVNQQRVLNIFRENRVSDTHFNSTSGYGYDDLGRETLEQV